MESGMNDRKGFDVGKYAKYDAPPSMIQQPTPQQLPTP